jgi:hypothetical protein
LRADATICILNNYGSIVALSIRAFHSHFPLEILLCAMFQPCSFVVVQFVLVVVMLLSVPHGLLTVIPGAATVTLFYILNADNKNMVFRFNNRQMHRRPSYTISISIWIC